MVYLHSTRCLRHLPVIYDLSTKCMHCLQPVCPPPASAEHATYYTSTRYHRPCVYSVPGYTVYNTSWACSTSCHTVTSDLLVWHLLYCLSVTSNQFVCHDVHGLSPTVCMCHWHTPPLHSHSIVSHSDHKPRVHSICRTKLTTFLPVWICSTTSSHQLGSAALAEIISSLAKMHAIMHQVTHHINKAWVSGAVNLNTTQLSPFVTSSIHYQLCSNSIIMQSTSPCPVHILLLIPHPYHMVCHPTW
jgi:hypothetical protein